MEVFARIPMLYTDDVQATTHPLQAIFLPVGIYIACVISLGNITGFQPAVPLFCILKRQLQDSPSPGNNTFS